MSGINMSAATAKITCPSYTVSKGRADQSQPDAEARRVLEGAQERFRQGRLDEAVTMLEGFLSRRPAEPDVLAALAVIEHRRTGPERAISLLTRAVELAPDSFSTLCWLSHFLLQGEQPELAKTHAERAVRISPRNAAAHVTLAQCLYRLGRHDDAIGEFYQALELDPNNPMILSELGEALMIQRLWPQAADILLKSALVAPEPERFLRLAALEHRLGRLEQAENHCRRVVRKGGESAESELLLAKILTERANLTEAQDHWARALALGADSNGLNLDRAISLVAIGRFDDALEILERAAVADPIPGDVCRSLAFARRVSPGDRPLIARMESALSESGRSPADRMALLYALGKAHDDLGDYEKAIGFFDQANALRVETDAIKPFDEAELESFVDASIAFYSRSRFLQTPLARAVSVSPVLVVGMMRSGTTLAEQILTCHPSIGGAGEQSYWADHDATVIDYAVGSTRRAWTRAPKTTWTFFARSRRTSRSSSTRIRRTCSFSARSISASRKRR